MSIVPVLSLSADNAALEVEIGNQRFDMVVESSVLEIGGTGPRGSEGLGTEPSEVSWQLFERAGIASKDDDIFPTLITKSVYEGVTNGTRVISRTDNVIINSVVDEYDYASQHYTWTTPYLGGTDLLKNRPGTPSVVVS